MFKKNSYNVSCNGVAQEISRRASETLKKIPVNVESFNKLREDLRRRSIADFKPDTFHFYTDGAEEIEYYRKDLWLPFSPIKNVVIALKSAEIILFVWMWVNVFVLFVLQLKVKIRGVWKILVLRLKNVKIKSKQSLRNFLIVGLL